MIPKRPRSVPAILLSVALTAVLASSLSAGIAAAQPAAGAIAPDQLTGSASTLISGATTGPCDEPGTPDLPVDGFNVLATGPGVFAAEADTPDGIAVVQTDNVGLSTTEPIRFTFRATLAEIASEEGGRLLPGDYVITLRCVNQLFGVAYQTYTATYTFTGGPPATAFTVTAAGADGVPPPPGAASPHADPPALAAAAPPAPAASGPAGGPPTGLLVGTVVALVLGGGVVARRRRSTAVAPRK